MITLHKELPPHCYPGRTIQPAGEVIHFISGRYTKAPADKYDVQVVYDLLCGLNLPGNQRGPLFLEHDRRGDRRAYASYHDFITRDGILFRFLPHGLEAYHAGRSIMNGRADCNDFTLGVALAGMEGEEYTDAQYETLAEYTAGNMIEYQFSIDWVMGHDQVRDAWLKLHPGTDHPKPDPGSLFDWSQFHDLVAIHYERMKR